MSKNGLSPIGVTMCDRGLSTGDKAGRTYKKTAYGEKEEKGSKCCFPKETPQAAEGASLY